MLWTYFQCCGHCLLSLPQVKMLALSFLGALKCQTESCSATGLNDTPCQRGKFISSHWECHRLSCPEPRQVMDWIYPSLDKACAQTCTHMHSCTPTHTYTHITVVLSAPIGVHFTQSSTHASHSTYTSQSLHTMFVYTTHSDNLFENLCDIRQTFRQLGSKAVMYCQQLHG